LKQATAAGARAAATASVTASAAVRLQALQTLAAILLATPPAAVDRALSTTAAERESKAESKEAKAHPASAAGVLELLLLVVADAEAGPSGTSRGP
jgi:hypothetical protein